MAAPPRPKRSAWTGGSPAALGNARRYRLAVAVVLVAAALLGLILLLVRDDDEPLTIYASLSLQGMGREPSEDLRRAMLLALEQAEQMAGGHMIKFVPRDGSTKQVGSWTESAVANNAIEAADDEQTAVYIGEQSSGASAVSIPILSRAGIAQISTGSTAVGLTTDGIGAEHGAPDRYYLRVRNFARLIPRDTLQGDAIATLMREDGCRRAAIVNDGGVYGAGLARNITASLKRVGVGFAFDEPLEKQEPSMLADRVVRQQADCFAFSGTPTSGGAPVVEAVAEAVPHARLYAPDALARPEFTDELSETVASRVKLTAPFRGDGLERAAGLRFLLDYAERYPKDPDPDPYAIYGYEAMLLALDVISRAKSTAREDIVDALFATKNRSSVLGRYSIRSDGDTTIKEYYRYEIQDGEPIFRGRIAPRR